MQLREISILYGRSKVWRRAIANGLDPRIWPSNVIFQREKGIRFGGHSLVGPDFNVALGLGLSIWGGEYDHPGFVPAAGERVVDVGGNVGIYAVLAASKGAAVDSYEPHPQTFAYLERNTRPWPAVTAHHAAVVGTDGGPSVTLHLHPSRDDRHSVVGRDVFTGDALTSAIEVPATTLEAAVGDGCDLLKLDCEGSEFDVLTTASDETLARVPRIVAEVHAVAGEPTALVRHLRERGYSVATPGHDPEHLPDLAVLFAQRR
jgi:FkbM family methyltransferase